ncbi:hypothetical protein Golob_008839 [Gossypium lobatum]|uniref:Uncharacterized protein n=1 Tax=Gossypium lobatum TaxID=34289 RepID=A0A7J8MGM1_9ROSI|nr:hypothetical protein [Gossypium lobatum]
MSIVALKGTEPVVRPISQGFSRTGVMIHTVILRMIRQAPLLAPLVPITGLCFALEAHPA